MAYIISYTHNDYIYHTMSLHAILFVSCRVAQRPAKDIVMKDNVAYETVAASSIQPNISYGVVGTKKIDKRYYYHMHTKAW